MYKSPTWHRLEAVVGAPVTKKDWQWVCQCLCDAPVNQEIVLPLLEKYWRRLHPAADGRQDGTA
jgi:hypothetical protein